MRRSYLIVALVLIASAFAATAWVYPELTATVPSHWNIRGEVDARGPKSTTWIMPCVMLAILGLFLILPKLSPRPFAIDPRQPAYLFVMVTTVAMMGYIHAVTLRAAFSPRLDIIRALVAGLMLGLALIGNVMGKIKRNLYMGVRTPWTLANDRVWVDTHRVAAWWLVGGSIVGFLLALSPLPAWAGLLPLIPAIFWPILYSYLLFKRLERKGPLPEDAASA